MIEICKWADFGDNHRVPDFDDEQDAAECKSDDRDRNGDLRQRLLSHLRDPSYEPQNKSELSRAMEVDSRDRAELRGELRALEAEGLIVKIKKGRYELCESAGNTLIGTIRRDRKGNVSFHPDGNSAENRSALQALELEPEANLYVPDKFAHTSLHGDHVVVKVLETGIPKWWKHVRRKRELLREIAENAEKRLEARVVKILERRNNRIVGTFRREGKFDYVQPDDSLLPDTIDVQVSTDTQVQPGDKVIVTIEEWHSRNQHPRGRIVRSLGPADAPGVDILSIIHAHQLPLEFPPKVLQDAASIEEVITADEIAAREDWRDHLVVTIDPFDAKDFDDAIAVRRLSGEACGWELAVHIADVSHYVRPGSAIDREANDRGNSIYLVDRVIPMLPEQLSNGICSLKPGVDRLTRAAIMEFDDNGNRTRTRFCSAVIRSACRLTYEEAIVRMRDESPGVDQVTLVLQEAWRLAAILREKRFKEGALDLDFPEVRPVLDENGKPLRLVRIEYDESHQLIEEFMLAANEAVAETTRRAAVPSIYRTHDDPDPEKLYEFQALVQSLGIATGDLTVPVEVRRLMKAVKGHAAEYAIKIGLLKSMKRAAYDAEPTGHFGLAKANYTHFTSPIRRYADLIVHRVLWNLTNPSKPELHLRTPRAAGMQDIAEHISNTERVAADAEIESRRLKELEYLAGLVASKEQVVFNALVLEARRVGLFVELTDYFIKGLIKPDALEPFDDYAWDRRMRRFRGEQHGKVYETGNRLKVAIEAVDIERKFVDFRVVRS
ncbi:MAG: ribonuclease R [Verrucomicrobia bacterium]|nr:ribonuclease R [Verrucomicrobiota bacterium]